MTPLHNQIKTAIMPVLLETTTAAREQRAKLTVKKDELYTKMEALYKRALSNMKGISDTRNYINIALHSLEFAALAASRPDLLNIAKANGSYAPLDPLTVIVPTELSAEAVSYGLIVGLPYLVLHGIDKMLLSSEAHAVPDAYDIGSQYKCYPATDVEVEQFIDGLTPPQLRWILASEMFSPYLEDIFNPPAPAPADPEVQKLIDEVNESSKNDSAS